MALFIGYPFILLIPLPARSAAMMNAAPRMYVPRTALTIYEAVTKAIRPSRKRISSIKLIVFFMGTPLESEFLGKNHICQILRQLIECDKTRHAVNGCREQVYTLAVVLVFL